MSLSYKATTWAWGQKGIPWKPKFVLVALADWYNELESCAWPTYAQLADKTGMSKSSVQRGLRWLVENKLVVVEPNFKHNRQQANRYRLPVNIMVFQGGLPDTPIGGLPDTHGCLPDQPIKNTVKDTVKDTINSGEPQESDLKIQDVIESKSKSKDEILTKFTPTPKGCGDLWRDCRAASGEHGFQAELLNKDWSMLNKARKRIASADFRVVVWTVMQNWIGFTKFAESQAGAFNCPLTPQVAFFVKFIEAAADYAKQSKPEVAVKLIAKPLTNKPEPSKPIPKVKEPAITIAELLAMNKDDE